MEPDDTLVKGGIVVLPTDTIYGLVARAQDEHAVNRVYAAKGRTSTKPCILLISRIEDVRLFGVSLDDDLRARLSAHWPGAVSIILKAGPETPSYLDRGTHTLAFRMPAHEQLHDLIARVGPLIAPSANPEGLPPAATIQEAQEYFADTVSLYVDGGRMTGKPSTVIDMTNATERIVRRG